MLGAPASTGCANSLGAGFSGEARTPPSPISPWSIGGGGTGPASASPGVVEAAPASTESALASALSAAPASVAVVGGGFVFVGLRPCATATAATRHIAETRPTEARRNTAGILSAPERNEDAHAERDQDVVHQVLLADELLLEDVIAHVQTEREPFAEVPLRSDAGAAGHADRRRVVGDAGAEGEVEVEAAEAAAHPAKLAVGERPDQVAEIQHARLVVRLLEDELRVAAVERVGRVAVEARVLEARLEREV